MDGWQLPRAAGSALLLPAGAWQPAWQRVCSVLLSRLHTLCDALPNQP